MGAEFLYLTDKKDPAERRIRAIEIEISVAAISPAPCRFLAWQPQSMGAVPFRT